MLANLLNVDELTKKQCVDDVNKFIAAKRAASTVPTNAASVRVDSVKYESTTALLGQMLWPTQLDALLRLATATGGPKRTPPMRDKLRVGHLPQFGADMLHPLVARKLQEQTAEPVKGALERERTLARKTAAQLVVADPKPSTQHREPDTVSAPAASSKSATDSSTTGAATGAASHWRRALLRYRPKFLYLLFHLYE